MKKWTSIGGRVGSITVVALTLLAQPTRATRADDAPDAKKLRARESELRARSKQ